MPPFFTIITATYHAAATLPRLLDSLAAQTCKDFIWVAQDGGSTDETLTVIETWRDTLPAVSVECAPDTGIYDAWNKALHRQGDNLGQWVLFLGADDVLAGPDILARCKLMLEQLTPGIILAAGEITRFSEARPDETVLHDVNIVIRKAFARRYNWGMPLPHPALFCAGTLFSAHLFDSSFRIAGDYDWLLRVWKHEDQAIPLNVVVTRMSIDGISNSPMFAATQNKEVRKIIFKHCPVTYRNIFVYTFLMLESLVYTPKLRLKALVQQFSWGNTIWSILQKYKKKCFK